MKSVRYQVQALRSTAVGLCADHVINFGTTFHVNAPGPMQVAA